MHTAPAKASSRARLRLPHWAQPDNPLVQRELDALPGFLGKQTTRRDAILFVGLATLGLGVTACLCVGLWQIILVPLSMLPIIFSATIINRETVAGRWDDLRMTPYTIHEIVGAKLAAVLYRLAPLLGVLLGITLLSSGVSWVFSLLLNNSYISVNGTPVQTPDAPFVNIPAILLITALLVGVSLLQTALDFLLSLVTGGLASVINL